MSRSPHAFECGSIDCLAAGIIFTLKHIHPDTHIHILVCRRSVQDVTFTQQRRHFAGLIGKPQWSGTNQHMRQAGMQRKLGHVPSMICQAPAS